LAQPVQRFDAEQGVEAGAHLEDVGAAQLEAPLLSG